jgi:serine phosphatase RsbU (regulator of sigma subunit)
VKKLFLQILLITLSAVYTSAAKTHPEDSERKWIFSSLFGQNTEKTNALSGVFREIVLGNYSKAEQRIEKLMKTYNKDKLFQSTLRIYLANIRYNQSAFQESANHCDSALQLSKGFQKSYLIIHKANNFKAKAISALSRNDEAIRLLRQIEISCRKTNDDYNLGASLYYLGAIHSDMGDYELSSHYLIRSIPVRRNTGDQLGLAASYAFLGLCYAGLDRYDEAIDVIHKSIKIRERLKDKRGLANSYLSMYKVYFQLGEIQKAMQSEYKSLTICNQIKDLQCVSGRYTNLGQLHQKLGQFKKAYYFHKKALALSKKLDIKNRIALVHENLARLSLVNKKEVLAERYIDSSFLIRKEINDEEGIMALSVLRAELQLKTNKTDEARISAMNSLKRSKELNIRSAERDAYQILSEIELRSKDYKAALDHYKNYVSLKDSLFSIDQSKQLLRQELQLNYERKELREKEKQKQIKYQAQRESSYQKRIITASVLSLLFVSALFIFSLVQYRSKTRSQRRLEITNLELRDTNQELALSKQLIELQHAEITDSLNYAQQIQKAILPKPEDIRSILSDSFVLYFPKDLISGDFYWITELEKKKIIVVADGTGHGVPGGFLTMLGVAMLNELVLEQKCTSPSEILNLLRSKVIAALRQTTVEGAQKDGFDMSVVVLNESTGELIYASANQTIFIEKESELLSIRGDHFPVGMHGEQLQKFNEYTVKLKRNDYVYLMTDGFSDQFGGIKNKKYKIKNMQSLLADISGMTSEQRASALKKEFQDWKGTQPQTDDVTIFGFKV